MKAVVFIDVQKDFIDGALRNEMAIAVTPKIVEFAKECVKAGHKLYATRDTHEATKYSIDMETPTDPGSTMVPESGYFATLEGERLPIEHCIEGTDGWMIDNRLMEVLDGKCTFVNKPTFGSFDLAKIINEDFFDTYQYVENLHCNVKCNSKTGSDLDEIVLCGFCTDICVVSNAMLLRAKFPNTKITVMKDLCAGITKENHNNALEVMKMCQIDVI